MARSTIDRFIVNSPCEEPAHHWRYDRTTRRFDLAPGRRPAGYVVASEDSRAFDDPGTFVEIPLVNAIWSSTTRRITLGVSRSSPAPGVAGSTTGIAGGSGVAGGSRVGGGPSIAGIDKAAIEEATRWVGGLDRIDRARGILRCHDFSATPFAPSGRKSSEEALFGWIVSDFGLNDAIEAGLVKTPRVVVRDDALPDAGTWKSRLYPIYNDPEVKDDLNRRAGAGEPLPDLVLNGYYLLGYDWRETARRWAAAGFEAPPTMITVANRTETAARVKHAFDTGRVRIDELCDPERTLHIDSKVLGEAEAQDAAEPIGVIGDPASVPASSARSTRSSGSGFSFKPAHYRI